MYDFYISVPSNKGKKVYCAVLLFKQKLLASVALNERLVFYFILFFLFFKI